MMFLRVCFGCHVLEGYGMTGRSGYRGEGLGGRVYRVRLVVAVTTGGSGVMLLGA
jgi:hypothetical protein